MNMRHAVIASQKYAPLQGANPRFQRVTLRNFRNFESARLELPEDAPQAILLWGANGAGKTNFLEALSLFGRGRGLRSARLAELQRRGVRESWAVAAELDCAAGQISLGTGLASATEAADREHDASPNRRRVRIDGKDGSPAALAKLLSITWLTPRMDRIFLDSATDRLRFFDRITAGAFPDHNAALNAYDRAHRERLKVLTDPQVSADDAWLKALEARMAEHAVAIMAARRESIDELNAELDRAGESSLRRPRLALAGPTEINLENVPALDAEEAFRAALKRVRRQEAREGRAAIGPKRADLEVTDVARGMPARLASTGEQKAMLISLFLAHVRFEQRRRGAPPVVLLDEVAAHLDRDRRHRLLGELCDAGAQIWMSATDETLGVPAAGAMTSVHLDAGTIRVGNRSDLQMQRDKNK